MKATVIEQLRTPAIGGPLPGPAVEHFEAELARRLGVRHCIEVYSGASALRLALLACRLGPGDEVITTPATSILTPWIIRSVGAKPVFVDIEPEYYCLDPQHVNAAITPRTKAIVAVHLYGQAADVQALHHLACRRGVTLIEDACQAFGGAFHGRPLGTFGQVNCLSLYPNNNVGAGKAGAVLTDDDVLVKRLYDLRDHVQRGRRVHTDIGFDLLTAGTRGSVFARRRWCLEESIAQRRHIARQYTEVWRGLPGLYLPAMRPGTDHAWHSYTVRVEDRTAFRKYLSIQGVRTGVPYPAPAHLHVTLRHLGYRVGDFPHAEALCRTQVRLPLFPEMTASEVERVQAAVGGWAASREMKQAA